ncbi:MAG: cellulase family glycosylhydrolase [Cytophagaceae bacterium]
MKKTLIAFLMLLSHQILHAQTPWLHVDGNKIKDPAGNVVILRGVDLQDIKGQKTDPTVGLNGLIDRLTDTLDASSTSPGWYTRVIRFTVNPVVTDLPTYYSTVLKPAVDYATSKGLYVIIDNHYIADIQSGLVNTNTFWSYMAPKFRDYSNVFYEVYNEPVNTSWSWSTFKPYMQSWVDLIRKHAPHNLILAGSPSWDQKMGSSATDPLIGENIVYVAHMYPSHYASANLRAQVEQASAAHPVFLTEWGFSNSLTGILKGTASGYGTSIMHWADSLGLSWTAWCADNDWNPAMFTNNWVLRTGDNEMGVFVKDMLYQKRNDHQPTDISCIAPYIGYDQTLCGKATVTIQSGIVNNGQTFRWYLDGALLSGETSPDLSVSQKGTYRFEVDTNTCTMYDELLVADTLFPVDLGPNAFLTDSITLIAGDAGDPFTYVWSQNGNILASEVSNSMKVFDTCKTYYSVSVSYPGCGTATDTFTILCKRALYLGHPIQIPGILQAEYYDVENVPNLTYSDSDPGNNGGALRTDAVDVEVCSDAGGGYNVGWINAAEWLEYTIHVNDPGSYTASFRIASNATGGGQLRIENAAHTNISGLVNIPFTGGWQTWTTVQVDGLLLSTQDTILRIYFTKAGFNLNYVDLEKTVTGLTQQGMDQTVSFYPNPVTDRLNISGIQKDAAWEIQDMLGNTILKGSGEEADLGGLGSGLYILRVKGNNFKILKK